MLKEGSTAPAFTTKDAEGRTVQLKDFRGQKVVLYFYPKDDTPGCTKEACSFPRCLCEFQKAWHQRAWRFHQQRSITQEVRAKVQAAIYFAHRY